MAMFPVFVDMKDKNCLVVGGGKVAERKIETLLQFSPRITVISPEVSERIQQFEKENDVTIIRKEYSGSDMGNPYLVIAATDNTEVNHMVYSDANNKGILVNVADSPEKCTFVFPSVVVRDDLVVGISTSGGFPALSRKVREKIEGILPEFYGEIISLLKACRVRAEKEIPDARARKKLLYRILDQALCDEYTVTEKRLKEKVERLFEECRDEKDN